MCTTAIVASSNHMPMRRQALKEPRISYECGSGAGGRLSANVNQVTIAHPPNTCTKCAQHSLWHLAPRHGPTWLLVSVCMTPLGLTNCFCERSQKEERLRSAMDVGGSEQRSPIAASKVWAS